MNLYCLDTSAIIDAGERYYPEDVFPSFWSKLDDLVNEGRLISHDMLIEELSRQEDHWRDWVYSRKESIITEVDEKFFSNVHFIMEKYPTLVDSNKGRSEGDPFFIALAITRGCTILTAEKARNTLNKPKIPDVCNDLAKKHNIVVPCIDVLGLIRAENWRF